MQSIIAHQIELAQFPAGVSVTQQDAPDGILLRVTQDGRGAELLLTSEAAKMYGEGPAVSLALTKLKHALAKGLPPLGEGGQAQRMVFLGD